MAGLGKEIIFSKGGYRFLRHLLFWLVYLLVFSFFSATDTNGLVDGFRTTLLFTPMNMLYVYVISYRLVPILIKEKYFSFFFLYCAWALTGLLLNFLFRYYILIPLRSGRPGPPLNVNSAYHQVFALGSFVVMNTISMFAIFIRMFKYWHTELRTKMRIEQEKTTAELELLKAQLHPHFLFNTLNNLYSLVVERSERAPDMLLRLSALLSYVLYECKATEVPLENEIRTIRDYVTLEQERYGDRLEVSLNFSGDIPHKRIAPMLFQPFVENAFKHGTAEQVGRVWMSIELSVKGRQLFFRAINSVDWKTRRQMAGGIGINNVRRRLELLYPGRYTLQQDTGEDVYIVSLTIELEVAA